MAIKEEEKFVASNILEGMTSISAVLNAMGSDYNDRRIQTVWVDRERTEKLSRELRFLRGKAKELHFTLQTVSSEDISAHVIGNTHGGVIAFCTERTIPTLTADCLEANGFYVYLEGIEDPYNFGYSLRSLYATGCQGILLPMRNWMSAAGVVCRSSAGASELFPMWEGDALEIVRAFKQKGYRVVCAHEKTNLVLGKCEMKLPLLLLVGGEKRGISSAVLEEADMLVKIDYSRDFHASLSAASATTIFAYEIARQND